MLLPALLATGCTPSHSCEGDEKYRYTIFPLQNPDVINFRKNWVLYQIHIYEPLYKTLLVNVTSWCTSSNIRSFIPADRFPWKSQGTWLGGASLRDGVGADWGQPEMAGEEQGDGWSVVTYPTIEVTAGVHSALLFMLNIISYHVIYMWLHLYLDLQQMKNRTHFMRCVSDSHQSGNLLHDNHIIICLLW